MKSAWLIKTRAVVADAQALQAMAPLPNSLRVDAHGIIQAVGDFEALRQSGDHIIDCADSYAVPGFVEGHAHLALIAEAMRVGDVGPCQTLDALIQLLQSQLSQSEGAGVTTLRTSRSHASHDIQRDEVCQALCAAAGQSAVIVKAYGEHSAWLSPRAAQWAGLTESRPQVVLHSDHSVTVSENAMVRAFERIAQQGAPAADGSLAALHSLQQQGITTLHDLAIDQNQWMTLQKHAQQGALPMPIRGYFYSPDADDYDAAAAHIAQHWPRTSHTAPPFFAMVGLKLFLDGTLGSSSAHLSFPYLHQTHVGCGSALPHQEARRIVQAAMKQRIGLAIHTIGDQAVSQALDLIEEAASYGAAHHIRLEHVQFVQRRDVARMRRLGVIAGIQFAHYAADRALIETQLSPVPQNVLCYPWRTLAHAHIPLIAGTDCPIAAPHPLNNLAEALSRDDHEALDLSAAAPAYWHSAHVTDAQLGALRPGNFCQLTLLNGDLRTTPPQHLKIDAVLCGTKLMTIKKD